MWVWDTVVGDIYSLLQPMQLSIYVGYKKRWRNREVDEGVAWVWRSRMEDT
jgi:hypothetical protein